LRLRIVELEAELALPTRTGKSSRKSAQKADDSVLNHELLVKLGKKYAVMVFPWPKEPIFMAYPDKNGMEPEHPARFKTIATFEDGLVAELHSYLKDPNLCKLAAEYAPFKSKFLNQVKQGRSSAIYTIRESAHIIFDGIGVPPLTWESKSDSLRRGSSTLQTLLSFPGKSVQDEKEPFSPIHYPDGIKDATKTFLNEYQPK
ncbi:hypothetical protein GYMLUDRAFT_115508, partial [Collybiopsis luxurians FD-317 M1]